MDGKNILDSRARRDAKNRFWLVLFSNRSHNDVIFSQWWPCSIFRWIAIGVGSFFASPLHFSFPFTLFYLVLPQHWIENNLDSRATRDAKNRFWLVLFSKRSRNDVIFGQWWPWKKEPGSFYLVFFSNPIVGCRVSRVAARRLFYRVLLAVFAVVSSSSRTARTLSRSDGGVLAFTISPSWYCDGLWRLPSFILGKGVYLVPPVGTV